MIADEHEVVTHNPKVLRLRTLLRVVLAMGKVNRDAFLSVLTDLVNEEAHDVERYSAPRTAR